MDEIWKDIVGYEGYYQVSNLGRIKSLDRYVRVIRNGKENRSLLRGRILKPRIYTHGYLSRQLSKENINKTISMHKLVAHAFIGIRPEGLQINHKDTVKTNNYASNLEYITPKENTQHSIISGVRNFNGCNSVNSKLTQEDIINIRKEFIPRVMSSRKLGKKYGVSKTCILYVVNKKTYVHI